MSTFYLPDKEPAEDQQCRYHQTSNISPTFVDNKIVDYPNIALSVVGAPTKSFST